MALTTSLNSTMLVPSRLAIILARDGLAPPWLGAVNERTGTPILGLTLTLAVSVFLLVSQQIALALNIAVFALVILYALHSLIFLLLPRKNPTLFGQITVTLPEQLQRAAALFSFLSMSTLIGVQVREDFLTFARLSFRQRLAEHALTSVELIFAWGLIGAGLYAYAKAVGRRK
jgi:amino acid efflux transporter